MVSQNLTSWIDGAVWRRPHKNCLSGNWSAEGLWWWWTDYYFNAYIIVIRLFIYLYKRARRNAARSKPISNLCWLWPKLSSITRGSDNLLVVIKKSDKPKPVKKTSDVYLHLLNPSFCSNNQFKTHRRLSSTASSDRRSEGAMDVERWNILRSLCRNWLRNVESTLLALSSCLRYGFTSTVSDNWIRLLMKHLLTRFGLVNCTKIIICV